MYASTNDFIRRMEQDSIKYTLTEADGDRTKDRVSVVFSGENTDVRCTFFFSKDEEDVAIRVFDLVKVPNNKVGKIYIVLNKMNNKFRFAKFCLDEDDNTIQAEMDAAFRQHDVGEICKELLLRAVNICDDAYPEFMREIYA